MTSATAYNSLTKVYNRLHSLGHLYSLGHWDSAANMPSKGAEARANALAEIGLVMHAIKSDKNVERLINDAQKETLSFEEAANLREIRIDWLLEICLPEELVEKKSLLGSKCEHDWRTQRVNNDWDGFLINFRPVVECSIQEANLLQRELKTESCYDALMTKYEPGQSSATIRKLFQDIRPTITQYIKAATAK